jgi:hypothetical protein
MAIRKWHVRRGRGWAMMQHYFPSLSLVVVAAVTDQSKLPKDDGSRSMGKVMGCNG